MLHLLIVALLFIPYLNGIAIKEFNDKPAFSSNYLGIAQFDTFCDANATNALNGTLTTPNYPGNYSNNLDCYYYIYSPVAYNIHVLVDYFSTEACCDYFEISTSTTNSSWSTIAHLNGANGTVNLSYVLQNNARLRFHSDGSVVSNGIHLTWNSIVIRDPNPAYISAQKVANRNTDIYVLSEDRYHAPTDIWDTLTQNQQSHIINGTVYSGVGDLFSVIGPKLLPEFNNMNCQTR
jgi:hypothetical protein